MDSPFIELNQHLGGALAWMHSVRWTSAGKFRSVLDGSEAMAKLAIALIAQKPGSDCSGFPDETS